MAALTGITSINTAANANSNAVICNGGTVYYSMTTNQVVTVKPQVSQDNSTFYDLSYPVGNLVLTPLAALGNIARSFDVGGWQYFRVNIANASGSTATITADVTVLPRI